MREIEYFNGDDLAASVWRSKYSLESEKNPDDMHRRLAKEFARIEEDAIDEKPGYGELSKYGKNREHLTENKIYNLFKDFKYIIPQGSIMYGLGRKDKYISLSNCFVLPSPFDSYGGIMKVDEEQVQLMKRRAGVGFDISNLRPSETLVTNSAGTSTGVVSFMERYSNSTREVGQNSRRGALMLSIDINHPDVEQFATVKSDLTKVTGANISIRLNKEFIKAVENDEDYILRFPCDLDQSLINKYSIENYEYNKLEKINRGYIKRIKARELWNTIITQARNNAEPGLMFWDNVLNNSPDGVYEQYKPVSSNPCGEQFLQGGDSCRLMCMNLFSFVNNPFTDNAEIDYKKLYEVSYEQQRLMDDLVDLEIESIEKIIQKIRSDSEPYIIKERELNLWTDVKKQAINGRRTGSGITALADMLAAIGVKYDSDKGLEITDKVMKTKMEAELDCSIDLAILRGGFSGHDVNKEFAISQTGTLDYGFNKFYNFILENFPDQAYRMSKYKRRNISFSTIAPTGSVSILTQSSSGCEPVFMPFYMRRKKINPNDKNSRIDFTDQNGDKWQEYPVLHPKFKEWCLYKIKDAGYGIGTPESVLEYYLTDPEKLELMFKQSPWYKSTANDINWEYRLRMQEVLQRYTSNAISSTLNLPENTSVDTVSQIYTNASQMGLKGVTVYVDGSRSGVLVSETKFKEEDAYKRPEKVNVKIHHLKADNQKWTIIIGFIDNKPYEVFGIPGVIAGGYSEGVMIKNNGYQLELFDENITIKKDVLKNVDPKQAAITRLISWGLRHRGGVQYAVEQLEKQGTITSFTKALARTLKQHIPKEQILNRAKCEECNSTNLHYEEGCLKCLDCGSSKCG